MEDLKLEAVVEGIAQKVDCLLKEQESLGLTPSTSIGDGYRRTRSSKSPSVKFEVYSHYLGPCLKTKNTLKIAIK